MGYVGQAPASKVVTSADIADDAVNSDQIAAGAIDAAHMSVNSIDSDSYVDDSIDAAHYAAGSVDTTALGADSVTAAKIGDNVLDSEHYAAGSIDNEHLADDAVDSDEIAAGAIDTAHLAADVVTGAKIADDALDSEHYAAGSIDTAHIADNQITLAKMAGGTDGQILTYDANGDPVAVGPGNDGQVLTSTGSGSPPAFEDVPGGGITRAEQWRLHTSLSSGSQSGILVENWEVQDTTGDGIIDHSSTNFSVSSGVFTFPETGMWQILVKAQFSTAGSIDLKSTQDANAGSPTFTTVASSGQSAVYSNPMTYGQSTIVYLMDVDSVTTDKIKFEIGTYHSNGQLNGSSTQSNTTVLFTRLGDT